MKTCLALWLYLIRLWKRLLWHDICRYLRRSLCPYNIFVPICFMSAAGKLQQATGYNNPALVQLGLGGFGDVRGRGLSLHPLRGQAAVSSACIAPLLPALFPRWCTSAASSQWGMAPGPGNYKLCPCCHCFSPLLNHPYPAAAAWAHLEAAQAQRSFSPAGSCTHAAARRGEEVERSGSGAGTIESFLVLMQPLALWPWYGYRYRQKALHICRTDLAHRSYSCCDIWCHFCFSNLPLKVYRKLYGIYIYMLKIIRIWKLSYKRKANLVDKALKLRLGIYIQSLPQLVAPCTTLVRTLNFDTYEAYICQWEW